MGENEHLPDGLEPSDKKLNDNLDKTFSKQNAQEERDRLELERQAKIAAADEIEHMPSVDPEHWREIAEAIRNSAQPDEAISGENLESPTSQQGSASEQNSTVPSITRETSISGDSEIHSSPEKETRVLRKIGEITVNGKTLFFGTYSPEPTAGEKFILIDPQTGRPIGKEHVYVGVAEVDDSLKPGSLFVEHIPGYKKPVYDREYSPKSFMGKVAKFLGDTSVLPVVATEINLSEDRKFAGLIFESHLNRNVPARVAEDVSIGKWDALARIGWKIVVSSNTPDEVLEMMHVQRDELYRTTEDNHVITPIQSTKGKALATNYEEFFPGSL